MIAGEENTSESDRRATRIAAEVMELDEADRPSFMRDACGDDAALRSKVEALLEADASAGSFLLEPALARSDDAEEAFDQALERAFGERGHRIVRRLASGGMGVVYEAEQHHPARRVALKVIRVGMTSASALRRFDHEARVLGRLHHNGIAQIYEAGTIDTGYGPQPYFAMELVDGPPLLQYAAEAELDVGGRLRLFGRVCDAVQYAHQRGVIHRDLKPANILVADDGQPKVLDFGVARATDGDVQATTLHTAADDLLGTVPYMSPEQLSGDADEVDTRSDVYALGVTLYELLSGRLPHSVRRTPIAEAARIVRDEDPTSLSTVNRD
ncbi:MAG: serine/threonine-protein kinase, partial [Planctomycetota bacterium]